MPLSGGSQTSSNLPNWPPIDHWVALLSATIQSQWLWVVGVLAMKNIARPNSVLVGKNFLPRLMYWGPLPVVLKCSDFTPLAGLLVSTVVPLASVYPPAMPEPSKSSH